VRSTLKAAAKLQKKIHICKYKMHAAAFFCHFGSKKAFSSPKGTDFFANSANKFAYIRKKL